MAALFSVLIFGIAAAPGLEPLTEIRVLRYSIVATVLFLMALPLESRTIRHVLSRPGPAILATIINFGVLPAFAWLIVVLVSGRLISEELGKGILIAATTPATLASAAVWTRRAGGNDAVALMVTVITNFFCFVLTPGWLLVMTGASPEIDLVEMVVKLLMVVVAPMVLAQILRRRPEIAEKATAAKTTLGVLAQIGVLSMVLMGAIRTGIRLRDGQSDALLVEIAIMIALVLGIHVSMWYLGWRGALQLKMSRADSIAVGFSGSQKTLMVGLQVGMELGWSILPIVTYHVGQLLVDTLIADRLKSAEKARQQAASKATKGDDPKPPKDDRGF